MNQLAKSIQIVIKYLIFPKNNFFQQISQYSTSILAFGESVEAAKPPEMHHGKFLCFNPHRFFCVEGNVEHPIDYERAAVWSGTLRWHIKRHAAPQKTKNK